MCDHYEYKGVIKPRSSCLDCWLFWMRKHPDKVLTAGEIADIILSCQQKTKTELSKLKHSHSLNS